MSGTRFIATHADASREIDVEALGEGRYAITIGGERHEVDARRFEEGAWSVLIDDKSYDIELEVGGESERDGDYNALIRGMVVHLNVQDERQIRLHFGADGPRPVGPQVIEAPMPGKVVKILVKEGESVKENQPVVVVEAMKMENELRASAPGVVQKILIAEGDAVEAHAKLITFE